MTELEDEAGGLDVGGARLGSEGDEVSGPGKEIAVLEYSGGVSHDEINGTRDVTVTVELAARECPKCVLETFDGAFVEGTFIGGVEYGYSWPCVGTDGVYEP